ncbi:hypothetical protein NC652_008902 [Populus alba x Populus x berolinensis]|nr:hypothetical protein NC652_008902 [Populus alba x Populus x berolinensis]
MIHGLFYLHRVVEGLGCMNLFLLTVSSLEQVYRTAP